MLKYLLAGMACGATALAQLPPSSIEFANLREDVRGLVQRVGELNLRVEQLERENSRLQERASTVAPASVTVTQLDARVLELQQMVRTSIATAKSETLQQVSTQLEKLGQQTNAALEALARAQNGRASAVAPVVANEPAREGINYIVQKNDSLASIAKKTGARQQDIIAANKLADPSHIIVGQTLFIPGGK
jgi:LysM repeat protein